MTALRTMTLSVLYAAALRSISSRCLRSGLSGGQWALALGAYYRLASQLVVSQSLTGQFLAETPADNLLIQGILMGS